MALTIPSNVATGGNRAAGIALLAAGCLLAAVAAPRFVAGIVKIAGDPGATAVERNLPATPDMLDATIDARRSALGWYGAPQYSFDVGAAAIQAYTRLQFLPVRSPDEEKRYLEAALESFRTGLSDHPAQPYAWMQLAYAELIKSGASPRIGDLLRMSIISGPEEPLIVVPRISLALLAWNVLDLPTRYLVIRQIEGAAAYRTRELADMALRLGTGDFVKTALRDRPDLRARFEEFLFQPEEGSPLFR